MWKMLGMTAGQAALASLANRAGQMAIDSVFDGARSEDGSRARPRIERGLRAAGREIRAGRYGSADKIVRGLSGIRADEVRQHLSGEEIRAMQAWERGETGRDPHVVGQRAKLTSAERHKIPSSKFALPKERKYPIQDLAHAKSARSYATTEYQDGNLTKAQWETVYRKTAERYPDLDPKALVCEKKGRKKRCHSVPKGGRARTDADEHTHGVSDITLLTTYFPRIAPPNKDGSIVLKLAGWYLVTIDVEHDGSLRDPTYRVRRYASEAQWPHTPASEITFSSYAKLKKHFGLRKKHFDLAKKGPARRGGRARKDWDPYPDPDSDTIDLPISYGAASVLQRYWWGIADPLYAVLSRRGYSVDWVTVTVTREELARFREAAEEAARSDDPSEAHTGELTLKRLPR